jgi:hypothetical protein
MKLKKQQSKYFREAVEDLVSNNIDLHFSRTAKVDDCGGYFDPAGRQLKVATWNSAWFVTFIHEYNHYKQWKTRTRLWAAAEDLEFFEDFSPKHVLSVQLMEQECDKMSWKDIKEYDIESAQKYISKANAYHVSYRNMVEKKEWVKRAPYRFNEVLKLCPDDRFFTIKELTKPSKKLYDTISKKCF